MNVENNISFKSKEEIKQLQLGLLKKHLLYIAKYSAYYKSLFQKLNLDINSIDDFEKFKQIPLTSKNDFSKNHESFVCVPRNEIAEYTTTSGTLGEPVSILLSFSDIERLALNEYLSFKMIGCNSTDVIQLSTTMDKRFMAGMAYYEGVRKLKAGLVRVGASSPRLQWDSILRFGPKILIAIPSFILKMLEYAKTNGIDPNKTSVKKLIAIGQPIRDAQLELNSIAQSILASWNLEIYSTYASSEMATAFTECEYGVGGHLPAELIYVELLDDQGEEVGEGEVGEVVATPLEVTAQPLLRYKTGDMAKWYRSCCDCGRETLRLGPILGRKDHMLKVNGTTVHPSMLIPILDDLESVVNYLIEIYMDEHNQDKLRLIFQLDELTEAEAENICLEAAATIRVKPQFKLIALNEFQKLLENTTERKQKKILDSR